MSTQAEILVRRLLHEDWDTDAVDLRSAIRKEMQSDPSLDLETAKERAWQRLQAERRQKAASALKRYHPVQFGEAYGLKPAPKGPFNKQQLRMGKEEEREHTTDPKIAEIIAKHHLKPAGKNTPPSKQNYYSKLRKYVEPGRTRTKALLLAFAPSSSTPGGP